MKSSAHLIPQPAAGSAASELMQDIGFIVELDGIKNIFRKTMVLGTDRRENDAEHSWHIAVIAMLLEKYSSFGINMTKVLKMLLIHDIVELYAGDTFAYDAAKNSDKTGRERNAMELIKTKMSPPNAAMVSALWEEFEAKETPEAVYANAMDRLQPMLSNIHAMDGGTWREFGVRREQVLKRAEPIMKINDELYSYLISQIDANVKNGNILL